MLRFWKIFQSSLCLVVCCTLFFVSQTRADDNEELVDVESAEARLDDVSLEDSFDPRVVVEPSLDEIFSPKWEVDLLDAVNAGVQNTFVLENTPHERIAKGYDDLPDYLVRKSLGEDFPVIVKFDPAYGFSVVQNPQSNGKPIELKANEKAAIKDLAKLFEKKINPSLMAKMPDLSPFLQPAKGFMEQRSPLMLLENAINDTLVRYQTSMVLLETRADLTLKASGPNPGPSDSGAYIAEAFAKWANKRSWTQSGLNGKARFVHLLLTKNQTDLQEAIAKHPNVSRHDLSLVDPAERAQIIQNAFGSEEQKARLLAELGEGGGEGKAMENFVRLTKGLPRTTIANIVEHHAEKPIGDQAITTRGVLEYVAEEIRRQTEGAVELYKPEKVSLEEMHGQKAIVKKYASFDRFIKSGQYNRLPGVTLHTGPQGVGKSMYVKYLASNPSVPVLKLNMGGIMSKWQGESEKNVANLLKVIKNMGNVIVFIDEADLLFPREAGTSSGNDGSRKFLQQQFLQFMEDEKGQVMFVLATARPNELRPDVRSRASGNVFNHEPDYTPEGKKSLLKAVAKQHVGKGEDPKLVEAVENLPLSFFEKHMTSLGIGRNYYAFIQGVIDKLDEQHRQADVEIREESRVLTRKWSFREALYAQARDFKGSVSDSEAWEATLRGWEADTSISQLSPNAEKFYKSEAKVFPEEHPHRRYIADLVRRLETYNLYGKGEPLSEVERHLLLAPDFKTHEAWLAERKANSKPGDSKTKGPGTPVDQKEALKRLIEGCDT